MTTSYDLPKFTLEFDSPATMPVNSIIEFLQNLPSETVVDVDGIVIVLNGCSYEGEIAGWYFDPDAYNNKGSDLYTVANLSGTARIRVL